MKRRHTEKGMALVITLMMLAIVTFMSVVFLSLSRRERTNVKTAEDQANARQMADAALERAKADMTSTMVNAVEKYLQGANPNFGDTNLQHQIAIANRAVQNGLLQYDLRVSRNFSFPGGFKPSEQGNPWNVSWDVYGNAIDNKGVILNTNSDNYFRQIANLQYDPRTPVIVSNGKTNDNRFYLDLDRNGMFDPSGVFDVTGPNNERYTTNNNAGNVKVATAPPYLKGLFVGDPEWIGVLERPDLPHSETNRFVGRYAYLMMPTGKSLDINYIHNLAAFTGNSTALAYGSGTDPRYSRNQGVGPWEMNLAGFLVDLHTNAWVPPSVSPSFYSYSTNAAKGLAFRDAAGLLQYRLNGSRANLQTPAAFFGANQNFTWRNDNVDMAGDGPIVPYNNLAFRRTLLTDTDDGTRYWHGLEQAEKTGEFPDVQRYFKLGTATATTDQLDFYSKFTNAVTSARTNTYDRYTYYRMLAQLGADSKPALQGKIHLNYLNEPGTISTNFYSWVSSNGPATLVRPPISIQWNVTSNRLALPSDPDYQVQVRTTNSTLTNFFLIAADAMLRADMVTNVFKDRLGTLNASPIGIRTNYTIGGSYFDNPSFNAVDPITTEQNPSYKRIAVNVPVRPNISVTNIQVFHAPLTNTAWLPNDQTYTNNEYLPEVHRVLQVAANIYDNMTNNAGRRSTHRATDPFFPTVWRPYYAITYTNITIVGWEPQDSAAFAITHTTNMVSMRDFFFAGGNRPAPGAPAVLLTNVNFYGQPWVIGAKKGWPNFNEFSIETFVDVARKLQVTKSAAEASAGTKIDTNNVADLAKRTSQIFLIGISNVFGLEAWNSYANTNHRSIRIESEIDATFGIERVLVRDPYTKRVFRTTNIFTPATMVRMPGAFTIPGTSGWPGRQSDKDISKARPKPGTPGIADQDSDFRVPIYTNAAVFPAVTTAAGYLSPFDPREYSPEGGPYGSLIGLPATWTSLTNIPDLRLNITNRIRYLAYDTAENKVIDYVTLDNLVTTIDLGTALMGTPMTPADQAAGVQNNPFNQPWDPTYIDKTSGFTRGIMQQILVSMGNLPAPTVTDGAFWRSLIVTADPLDKQTQLFRDYMNGTSTNFNDILKTNVARQVPYSPSRRIYYHPLYQANDPLVHYLASDLLDPQVGIDVKTYPPGAVVLNRELGKRNSTRQARRDDGLHGPWFHDPGIVESDDWRFPIANLDNNGASSLYGITNFQYRFPNIGALGQIHRGTPWQTIYLKAAAAANYSPLNVPFTPNAAQNPVPASWYNWSGSLGTHPTNDWKFVGLFTTAINETAARGLLSVNQTNIAAWSAVLSGIPVITNSLPNSQSKMTQGTQFGDPNNNFRDLLIEPGSKQLNAIVKNINDYRSSQKATVMGKFYYLGQILGTPMLSVGTSLLDSSQPSYSPYINASDAQLMDATGTKLNWHGVTDEALEAIPARILSLLKEDEPRVTIYCFGQSLKPAPRSLVTSTDFYNLCVNYQVTGEYVTKAVVRVEGEMKNPNNPLRTVVESFEVLPPFE